MVEPTVEVTGVVQLQERFHVVKGETARSVERAAVKTALRLLALSQVVVPVDTELLKSTGFASKDGSGFKTRTAVGYSTPYAVFVHEDLDAQHGPGKQAKYLTGPAVEHAAELFNVYRTEAQKKSGATPALLAPSFATHALLPIPPRGPGSHVSLVSGKKVTYVRRARAKNGKGGWRRAR